MNFRQIPSSPTPTCTSTSFQRKLICTEHLQYVSYNLFQAEPDGHFTVFMYSRERIRR